MNKLFFILFMIICAKSKAQTINSDCSDCASKILKFEQIENLSADEIRLLKNEIFARKGYQFDNYVLQNYFEAKPWYKSVNNNKSIVFNKIENENLKFLINKTNLINDKRVELINQLKLFKNLVLANKNDELKSKFGFVYENIEQNNLIQRLKEVLNKINLDEINYYKNKGIYCTIIDNGLTKINFEISIDGENINIIYNSISQSQIIDNFNESVQFEPQIEFIYNWQFSFINKQLQFVRFVTAG